LRVSLDTSMQSPPHAAWEAGQLIATRPHADSRITKQSSAPFIVPEHTRCLEADSHYLGWRVGSGRTSRWLAIGDGATECGM